MTYDFDVLSVIPKTIQTKYSDMFAKFGMTDQVNQKIAMFRDPRATQALAGASESIRTCFVSSGFALNGFDCGYGEGRFRASDQDHRAEILDRLTESIATVPDDARWNGFDIDAFFEAASQAMPVKVQRRSFASARQAVMKPIVLKATDRVRSRTNSRPLSRPVTGF